MILQIDHVSLAVRNIEIFLLSQWFNITLVFIISVNLIRGLKYDKKRGPKNQKRKQ